MSLITLQVSFSTFAQSERLLVKLHKNHVMICNLYNASHGDIEKEKFNLHH
jgi:hypothetical protein